MPTTWTHPSNPTLVTSTAYELLDHEFINDAFASKDMYWTKRVENHEQLAKMLEKSLVFGVYSCERSENDSSSSRRQIGFARLVTDHTTLAYLTDVFILPSQRGQGLGKWLMGCINETLESWPILRSCLLFVGGDEGEKARSFYRSTLGMRPFKKDYPDMELWGRQGEGAMEKH